jgi:Tol biopolymer transport system component
MNKRLSFIRRRSIAGRVAVAAVLVVLLAVVGAGLWEGLGGSGASRRAHQVAAVHLKGHGTSAAHRAASDSLIWFHAHAEFFDVRLDGHGRRTLTGTGDPLWSPDGSRFALISGDETGIEVANRDGSDLHRVTPVGGDWADSAPWLGSWSPDGHRLAFSRESNSDSPTDSVYVVNDDGSGLRLVAGSVNLDPSVDTPDSQYALEAVLSPDGRWLAYRQGTTQTQLFVMRPDGTDKRPLGVISHGSGLPDNPPVWSPDGKSIYSRELNGLARVGLDGGRRELAPGTYVRSFVLSPDGRRIAFVADSRLFVVPSEGGGRRPLSPPQTHAAWPPDYGFSADGRKILFVASQHSIYTIYSANSDGSHLRSVSPPGMNFRVGSERFSPDGAKIAFDARDGHIYLAGSHANRLRQLTKGRCPAWSPDGKWIAFATHGKPAVYGAPPAPEVDVIKANGSGKRRVSLGGGCPNWAPAQKSAPTGS